MEHSIEILRPVFLYIICNPVIMEVVDNAKSEAWQLVIKSSKATDLQMEILLWLCTSRESICVDSNCRLIELAETSMKKKNTEYCTALAPLIASVTIQLLEYKHNPANNFSMLLRLIRHCDNHIGNLMISLMTEIILICPDAYLSKAFRICEYIKMQIYLNIRIYKYDKISHIYHFMPFYMCESHHSYIHYHISNFKNKHFKTFHEIEF